MKKLIIWDFDGVISDTEYLWIENWNKLLKKYHGLNWPFETANKFLGGMSPKTKIETLSKLGIQIDETFLSELKKLDWEAMKDIKIINGVEDIFKIPYFSQCIATGGNLDKTERKLDILNLSHYFPNNHIFTAQQVEKGKPEPDLFLFAAKQMGFTSENAIVIEDSLAGLKAGLSAGMETIAFLGCDMNNNPENIQKVKDLGIKYIYFKMQEVKKHLEEI